MRLKINFGFHFVMLIGAAMFVIGGIAVPAAKAAPTDACSLLTQDQVSAIMSVKVGTGKSSLRKYVNGAPRERLDGRR